MSRQTNPATLCRVEVKELVEKASAALGGDGALASRLGYDNLNTAARTIAAWKSGKRGLSYEHTLTLLDAAGLLRRPEDLEELRRLNEELDELRARRDRRRGH